MIEPIHTFTSGGHEYKEAFEVFLRHTNQKQVAYDWLKKLSDELPSQKQLIDVGAGDGTLTQMLSSVFENTLAMEPNPALCERLKLKCSEVKVLPKKIKDVSVALHADLILCSHVLYYIDRHEWLQTVDKMAEWLKPGGALVLILQNPQTDCMNMLEYLYHERFDLKDLAHDFDILAGHRFTQELSTVPSYIETQDAQSAYTIAELVLNLTPHSEPVSRDLLRDHVNRFFQREDGTFHFSCNQDVLLIKKRLLH